MKKRSTRAEVQRLVSIQASTRYEDPSAFRAAVEQLSGAQEHIASGLESSYRARDWGSFEIYVFLASRHPSTLYTTTLCEALNAKSFAYNNDDIVTAFDAAGDPASVACLEEAMWWRPDWDEYHNLAIKCVWALERIVSGEAVTALINAVRLGPATISEAALRGLRTSSPPERQVRATFDEETVTVYQAFPVEIARNAVSAGRLVAPFSLQRMTWIKPSFLWMMYRSGWATKAGQERVLAIRIARAAFDQALSSAELTSFDPRVHPNHDDWQERSRNSAVRVQWDPDRTVRFDGLPWRCIQIGLAPPVAADYAHTWIDSIEDVTELVRTLHDAHRDDAFPAVRELVPVEQPYPVAPATAEALGMATQR